MNKTLLTGERVSLRPLQLSDAEGNYVNWLNDKEVCKYNSHGSVLYTKEMAIEYINSVTNSEINLVLAVILKENNTHIGNISLQCISSKNQNAEFAILIGEKECWGKGLSKEAALILIRHGFEALNLHRIYCGTSEYNTGMQKLALSLGMKQEGVRVEAMFKNGEFVDIIEYGILREDFLNKFKG